MRLRLRLRFLNDFDGDRFDGALLLFLLPLTKCGSPSDNFIGRLLIDKAGISKTLEMAQKRLVVLRCNSRAVAMH